MFPVYLTVFTGLPTLSAPQSTNEGAGALWPLYLLFLTLAVPLTTDELLFH